MEVLGHAVLRDLGARVSADCDPVLGLLEVVFPLPLRIGV